MLIEGTRYRWKLSDMDVESPRVAPLARALGVPPLVALLLLQRGLEVPDEAGSFLAPKLSDLHDPGLLPGADEAAERMVRAVRDQQPIVIYGDYDVDGITASAILWHVLRMAGAAVSCYVPHRIEEGYGLNVQAIRQLAEGVTAPSGQTARPLIVSVDCGITAVEPARAARDAGVDLIISDHHELSSEQLPDAFAIVHPRLDGSQYPFGMLCGAGVAFKLAWHFCRRLCGSERVPQTYRDLLLDLLSFAALGTVADVVPLVDENRIITWFGLGQIGRTRFPGLNALIRAAKLDQKKIDSFHVGFVLGPRLNACGRMGHAEQAVRLLTDADETESRDTADFLTSENERRRTTELRIFEQAEQMVREHGLDGADSRAIVLAQEGWHPGVIGIVAARLVDAFARPVIMLNIEGDEAHGSARSVDGVAIHEAIGHCADLLRSFGGHAMAAGLRLDAANVEPFRRAFTEYVNRQLEASDLFHTIRITAETTLDEMSTDMIDQIRRLTPFGRGNPNPLFTTRARLEGPAQRVGSGGNHLRVPLRQGRRVVYGIGFGLGDLADDLPSGSDLEVAFEPKVSTYQGQRRPEVHVKDVRRL
ncbi:MAG: single-stranded-DNA-specific exonuclease RecJ [Phycisphaeraceae bacterium]|nr:single-stranded-DNA-specific exonuclease RecJ [Phycisphaeraceae bacterium]